MSAPETLRLRSARQASTSDAQGAATAPESVSAFGAGLEVRCPVS
jgi:hypothetical protein